MGTTEGYRSIIAEMEAIQELVQNVGDFRWPRERKPRYMEVRINYDASGIPPCSQLEPPLSIRESCHKQAAASQQAAAIQQSKLWRITDTCLSLSVL